MKLKIGFILMFLSFVPFIALAGARAKYTLKVVDQEGRPIENAKVAANFTGSQAEVVEGRTNKKGLFTVSGNTASIFGAYVDKEGYYRSGSGVKKVLKYEGGLRWKPWNPTIEVVMKEKRNPIPMYMKGTFGYIEIPAVEEPIGFDLLKGDWVAPHGNGVVKDFILECRVRYDAVRDWESWYRLAFSNEKDGIQAYYPPEDDQSEYKWPYLAPETGYKPEIERFKIYTPDGHHKTNYDDERKYIFRVRTEVDGKGNIISAKYGRMPGEIKFMPNKMIAFAYRLNPTGTRNLEDSGVNLFESNKIE